MTTSVFSGAFGLFLLFMTALNVQSPTAMLTCAVAALAGWVVNVGQDIDSKPLAGAGAAVSVIAGAVALVMVGMKLG
jgi:hypothetical protein